MTDERLTLLESERQKALEDSNNTYSGLLEKNQNLYNQQLDYANEQEKIQNETLDKQLELRENQIEKQKETARENKHTEDIKAKNNYIGYTNQYGYEAENLASRGLLNSGISETSKLGAWNTYQNRLASANKTLQDAITSYDNEINEARVNYDDAKAKNALDKLKLALSYAENYFDTETTLNQNKLQNNQNINSDYNTQLNNVRNQIQNEKELEERIRQYNENMAYQKEQQRLEQERWERELAYQKEQDAIANSQKWASIYSSKSTSNQNTSVDNGTELTENNDGKNDNVVKATYTPLGLSKKAITWLNTNISNEVINNGGIKESTLESRLRNALNNKTITSSEADKILKSFGL